MKTLSDIKCNLCGGVKLRIIEKTSTLYNVVKCRNCGLVFVYPLPPNDWLRKHYNKDYYSEWISIQTKQRIRLWKKRINELKTMASGQKLLDVGCGEGLFLFLAQKEGFNVTGTEISEYACLYAKEKFGLEIFNRNLVEANFKEKSFDIITMWHVLEHLTDPFETLKEIQRIIAPDGLLVIAVPNLHNYLNRLLYLLVKGRKLSLFSLTNKELHLYHFSEKTIRYILDKSGFIVVRICPDLGQVEFNKKILDYFSLPVYFLTGFNTSCGIKIFARLK